MTLPNAVFAEQLERKANRIRGRLIAASTDAFNRDRQLQLAAVQNAYALAALYRHCDRLYPEIEESPLDLLPFNGGVYPKSPRPAEGAYSSPAASCMEL